jgi:hypothetical protein
MYTSHNKLLLATTSTFFSYLYFSIPPYASSSSSSSSISSLSRALAPLQLVFLAVSDCHLQFEIFSWHSGFGSSIYHHEKALIAMH